MICDDKLNDKHKLIKLGKVEKSHEVVLVIKEMIGLSINDCVVNLYYKRGYFL